MVKFFLSLLMSAMFINQGFAFERKNVLVKMKKQGSQNMSTIQAQFDSLVIRIAKAGITDVKQIEEILGVKLVPSSKMAMQMPICLWK